MTGTDVTEGHLPSSGTMSYFDDTRLGEKSLLDIYWVSYFSVPIFVQKLLWRHETKASVYLFHSCRDLSAKAVSWGRVSSCGDLYSLTAGYCCPGPSFTVEQLGKLSVYCSRRKTIRYHSRMKVEMHGNKTSHGPFLWFRRRTACSLEQY
jgi:hypothetical protein